MRYLLALTLVALMACGSTAEPGNPDDASTVNTTEAPLAAAEELGITHDEMILALRTEQPAFNDLTNDRIVGLANAVCDFLDETDAYETAIIAGQDSGFTVAEAAALTYMAVSGWCSVHLDLVEDYMEHPTDG